MGDTTINVGLGRVWEGNAWRIQLWGGIHVDVNGNERHECFDLGLMGTTAADDAYADLLAAAPDGMLAFKGVLATLGGGSWFNALDSAVRVEILECAAASQSAGLDP